MKDKFRRAQINAARTPGSNSRSGPRLCVAPLRLLHQDVGPGDLRGGFGVEPIDPDLPGLAVVEMPTPPAHRSHPFGPFPPNLGGEHRAETVPPEAHRLVADIDPALVQTVLDVPQLQREPDVEHHRQSDDLRRGLEVLERAALGHARKLDRRRTARQGGFL